MRLIYADDFLQLYEGVDESLEVSVRVVTANIEDMPTVDAVPVVRCITGETGVRFRIINDFCSRGERKENEQ